MGRLEVESLDIRDKFGELLVKTTKSLSTNEISIDSLTVLLHTFKIEITESDVEVGKLLSKAFKHCSFFSFRILKEVIQNFGSSNDKENLKSYESSFKTYCERRLNEVPINKRKPSMGHKINIKTDRHFNVPAEEVYKLQYELEKILGKPIHLAAVEKGCVELIVYVLHELNEIFPLNEKQMDQLKELGVLKVYSDHEEYYSIGIDSKKDFKLLSLCKEGNSEAVKKLLEEGNVDVDMRDSEHKDWTPIMWACEHGHIEVVELLIQHKASINLKAKNEWTPLHIACSNNFKRICDLLLEHGADPNAVMANNYTALMWLSDFDYVDVATSLLAHGADVEKGSKNGWTPLIQATHFGQKCLVILFLEHGANPNKQAANGWTALMAAARVNNGEIAQILIDNQADMNMVMEDAGKLTGESALHVASFMGSVDVIKVLIKNGANINTTNDAGLTALMIATKLGNVEAVEALLESETIDINMPLPGVEDGPPAIFLAEFLADENNSEAHSEIFHILFNYGARIDSHNISGAMIHSRATADTSLEEHQSVDEMPPLKKKALKRTKRDIQILLEKFSEYEKFNRTFYASHR